MTKRVMRVSGELKHVEKKYFICGLACQWLLGKVLLLELIKYCMLDFGMRKAEYLHAYYAGIRTLLMNFGSQIGCEED